MIKTHYKVYNTKLLDIVKPFKNIIVEVFKNCWLIIIELKI